MQFGLEFKKRQRFVQKTRKASNGQKVNFAVERLDVKAGVHTAAKVSNRKRGIVTRVLEIY